jgi:hypothetical protein
MTCDLDHDGEATEAARSVKFVYESKEYEIDLCDEHGEEYDSWMGDYVNHARRPRPDNGALAAPRRRQAQAPRNGKLDLKEIRTWAQANGYSVSDRGRVPTTVVEAFEKANP